MNKNLYFAFAILILAAVIGIYFRPLLIIDETRYIGVAWEMFDKNSFLVPFKNGEPYHHKPPFLFWLMHLNWLLFGVNEIAVRFIPLLFGLGSLLLTYKIYLTLWSDDKNTAANSALILSGTFIFAFYTSLVMFDIILTFWVLLGILGIIRAAKCGGKRAFVLIALSIGFGTLTKGPVILVHLLPLVIFAKIWAKDIDKRFFLGFSASFFGGVFIALLWAIPAGIAGGKEYSDAIFWGQSANRMVKSFAHQREFWWYLPIIPFLLFPWFFFKNFWMGAKNSEIDAGIKLLLVWLVSVVFIFSLISGKQIHYLMPEIAGFSLLCARYLSFVDIKEKLKNRASYIGHFYIVFSISLLAAYFIVANKTPHQIEFYRVVIGTLLLLGVGIYFIKRRFEDFDLLLKYISTSSVVAIFVIHFIMSSVMKDLDLSEFSQKLSSFQEQNITIVHDGKYHDQYHFVGRLHKPLLVIKDKMKLKEYLKTHQKALVITYKKRKEPLEESKIITKTGFKNKYAVLLKAKMYEEIKK